MIWPALLLITGLLGPAEAAPVRIAAASSLGPALQQLTVDADVQLTLGGSGQISRQLKSGAPADIVALAHPVWMDSLIQAGWVSEADVWTGLSNRLVVVSADATEIPHLTGLAELKRIGVGAPGVPLGQYTHTALTAVGLQDALADQQVLGASARATLAHAHAGAVDAAIVYRSDALGAPGLTTHFTIDPGLHGPIRYPLALTRAGAARPEAQSLFKSITSDAAMAVYAARGFDTVTESTSRTVPTVDPPVDIRAPVWRSVWVAAMALALSFVPALGLGWLLARRQFRGKALLNTLCLSPLVLPPVVTGWLLLVGMETIGLPLAFTRWAAVIAAAAVGFPLLLILVRSAIEAVDRRYELMAQTLGLTSFEAFRRVTFPMALPGIAAGCVLAFSRALGEFGATAMVAGDQPGETRTLALAIYALVENPGGETEAGRLVLISVMITLIALLVYERLVWRAQRRGEG